ncbi:redoxin domain-containing protein, partial [Candidatus Thorarchaeota archaeon]
NDIQFPLLSDWEKKVIHKYDVVLPNLAGMKEVAKRSVFVIDTKGEIVYKWVSDDPGKLPPIDEIKEALEGLQ